MGERAGGRGGGGGDVNRIKNIFFCLVQLVRRFCVLET